MTATASRAVEGRHGGGRDLEDGGEAEDDGPMSRNNSSYRSDEH